MAKKKGVKTGKRKIFKRHHFHISSAIFILAVIAALILLARNEYDAETKAQQFCYKQDVSAVYVCGNYIRKVSSYAEVGSILYSPTLSGVQELGNCPRTLSAEEQTGICRQILLEKSCDGKAEQKIC